MPIAALNTLLSSKMVVDQPISPVGPHSHEHSADEPKKLEKLTVESAPHRFDTLQKATPAYSVLVTASRHVPAPPRLSEYEYTRIMKRLTSERKNRKHLSLFADLDRKEHS